MEISVIPAIITLPQLPQFSILMNLYFVYVINIRFICDGEIYLLTYLHQLMCGGFVCVWFIQ